MRRALGLYLYFKRRDLARMLDRTKGPLRVVGWSPIPLRGEAQRHAEALAEANLLMQRIEGGSQE